jgi:hypothetical protein
MAVSAARIREIRSFFNDAARDLEGSPEFADLADVVSQAADAMDQMVDERGQMTEQAPPQVGSRVKRAEEPAADEGDEPAGDEPEPDEADPAAKKRKLPPQFRR